MNEKIKTEMISRRKALSLLGFGAALGFTLSSALEPLEAEAQEAAAPAAAPAQATGTHGMQRRQGRRAIAMNDATAVMSDDTSDERVKNQRRRRLPEHLPRNSVRLLSTACQRGLMNVGWRYAYQRVKR